MAHVFAFVETRGADLRKVGLEAVTAARMLADKSGSGRYTRFCSAHRDSHQRPRRSDSTAPM